MAGDGGWCQFDDLTAVNSTKFSIERVSKNHCPEYLKGIRGVAEYVQLPGDDGQCRRHGRLYGHDAELGADIASERTAPSRACQGDLGMSHQDWQAQWNQAMEARAGLPSVPASTTPDRGAGKAGRRFVRLRND